MPLIRLSSDALQVAHTMMQTWELHGHRCLAETMFEGRQQGTVFLDDLAFPRTALLCPVNGFYFVCGEPRVGLILETLPEVRRILDPKAFLNATSVAWRDGLQPHFARSVSRLGFARDAAARPPPPLPQGFEVAPIVASMALDWSRGDGRGLDPWVFKVWGGPKGFVERSFGFAVVHQGTPVAFTAACAIGGGEAEVEVGTAEAWRRRGFATASCLGFIAECEKRGLKPTWTADSTNQASVALAVRLGYRPTEEMWGFPLDAWSHRGRA